MKNAFTFSELMISLVIITILSAILYPTIAHFTPNSNKPLCKAAYKILNEALSSMVNDENRTDGELPLCTPTSPAIWVENNNTCENFNTSATALCIAFCEKTNVIPSEAGNSCAMECAESKNSTTNILTTSNGMTWKFDAYKTDNTYKDPNPQNNGAEVNMPNNFRIYVDVNSSNNSLDSVPFANHINMGRTNGVFRYTAATGDNGIFTTLPNNSATPPTKAVYNKEHLKAQDTFEFLVDRKGKIVSMSPAVYANLEDDINSQH